MSQGQWVGATGVACRRPQWRRRFLYGPSPTPAPKGIGQNQPSRLRRYALIPNAHNTETSPPKLNPKATSPPIPSGPRLTARNTPNRKHGKPAMSKITARRRRAAFGSCRLLLPCAALPSTVIGGTTFLNAVLPRPRSRRRSHAGRVASRCQAASLYSDILHGAVQARVRGCVWWRPDRADPAVGVGREGFGQLQRHVGWAWCRELARLHPCRLRRAGR